jgi:hypothetical protein
MPMCAICGGAGEGPRAEHRLTHGVSVWLCAAHRSDAFQTRRSGRDFVASLAAVWRAAGITTRRHALALEAHLRRVKGPNPRDRPGSYAWPELREQAEQRFAAGASLAAVERDIRAAAAREMPSRLPSARTFRRWFAEGRWLAAIRKQLSRRPAPRPLLIAIARTTVARRRSIARQPHTTQPSVIVDRRPEAPGAGIVSADRYG